MSAANKGHQKDEGIYFVKGTYKFAITNVSVEKKAAGTTYVKKGYVLDVCKALAGHHHHKKQ